MQFYKVPVRNDIAVLCVARKEAGRGCRNCIEEERCTKFKNKHSGMSPEDFYQYKLKLYKENGGKNNG